jgi:putative transcriptional regulator
MTLAEIVANPPKVDTAALAAVSDADIARYMIEDGEIPDGDLKLDVIVSPALVRNNLGLTEKGFAALLGIPLATLRRWEKGGVSNPAARALLRIVAREPQAALRALGK